MSAKPLEVFISYSHQDESLKEELEVHLASLQRQGKITPWQDRDIEAGEEWDELIRTKLESAQIVLLLVTPRFLASRYCFDEETQRAMQRHEEGTARVIPIIMKPCDWQSSPFQKLQVLPKDGKPVTRWDDQDEAFVNVVSGIRRVVNSLTDLHPTPDTPRVAPITTDPQPPSSPAQQRLALIQLLSSLPGPQFEQVVFALNPPPGNVPPTAAPLGQRVPALLEWAESPIGCGLHSLEAVVNQVIGR